MQDPNPMHHIPLTEEEISIVRTGLSGVLECVDVGAIAAATAPRSDGLSIISVNDEQRQRAETRLAHYANALRRGVETAINQRQAVLRKLVESRRGDSTAASPVHTHPLYLAAHRAVDDARRLADTALNVAKMWGPYKPDRRRIELALTAAGVNPRRNTLASTEAARQLFAPDGGNWSGSDLRGKAAKYSWHYVRRRRAIADAAHRLGMGEIEAGKHGRLRWVWSVAWLVPPDQRRAIPDDILKPSLTWIEDTAIASLAT